MGVPRHRGLHRLQLRSRSPGAYLCALGYSPYVGGGKFSEVPTHGQRDQVLAASSSATFYNIAAPGYNILSPWPPAVSPDTAPAQFPNNDARYLNGTSMAAPMVAGAAALVWGRT